MTERSHGHLLSRDDMPGYATSTAEGIVTLAQELSLAWKLHCAMPGEGRRQANLDRAFALLDLALAERTRDIINGSGA